MLHRAHRIGLLAVALAVFATPVSAQTGSIGYSWQGATMGPEGSGWPPDTNGSVGINQYVQAVNGGYQMYNKDGSGYTLPANRITNDTFWTSKVGVSTGSSSYTDPRVYYDPMSQHWFAVEITVTGGSGVNNRILVARSDTSDPRGAWHGTTFNSQTNSFNDFPTLAVDANALYIGTNNFSSSGFSNGQSLISIPLKGATGFLQNPTGAGSVASINHNLNSNQGNTLQGVTDTTGATIGQNTGLVLGVGVTLSPGGQQISRTLVNNSGASGATLTLPTTSNGGFIAIQNASTSPVFVPQLGTTSTLDKGDNRIGSSVYRVGDLVYLARAVNDGSNTRSVARWTILQVNNSTNAMTVVREGTVDLGGGTHAFIPSIAANARGDFVMSFSRSSSSEFPSIWAVVGSTTDHSTWSVGAPFQLQAGSTFQNIQGNSTGADNRWGDYSSTTRDPSDPGSFWVTNEYMHNVAFPARGLTVNDNWATQVVEVIPTIAGEVRWKNPAAGSFGTAINWQTGAAPGSGDHVIFSRWSGTSYQVDLPTATTTVNDRLSVRQTGTGTVRFNIASGATWSLTNTDPTQPSLAIAEFQGQSNVLFSGGGTLQSNFAIIGGQAGGTGNLTIMGSGTTWNNANDLFIGGTNAAAGGTGTLTVSSGATATISGTATLWNTASGITLTDNGSTLSVAGLTNPAGTTPTIAIGSGAALNITDGLGTTYSGFITGDGAVNKSGAGTMTFTGNNTYHGQTTVNAGTLLVNGQSGGNSGTGTGGVVINGGTVGGTGRILGTVAVNNTATLAGGVGGTGTLTIAGNTTLNSGGKLGASVGASGTSNQIAIQGATTTIDFKTGSILDLSLVSGFSKTASGTYTLVTLPSGSGNNILVDGVATANNAVLGTYVEGTGASGPVIIQPSGMTLDTGEQFTFVRSGDALLLQFSPVPEPATVLALSAAVLGIGTFVRRRRVVVSYRSSVVSHQ